MKKCLGTRTGIRIWSGNLKRVREIGIGIMLVEVVDVAAEDITTPMRDIVRVIVVRVVVKGMGGQLNGGGDYCWTLDPLVPLAIYFDRSFFFVYCSMHVFS